MWSILLVSLCSYYIWLCQWLIATLLFSMKRTIVNPQVYPFLFVFIAQYDNVAPNSKQKNCQFKNLTRRDISMAHEIADNMLFALLKCYCMQKTILISHMQNWCYFNKICGKACYLKLWLTSLYAHTMNTVCFCISVIVFLQEYGWFVLFGIVVLLYIKSKLDPHFRKLKRQAEDVIEQKKFGEEIFVQSNNDKTRDPLDGPSDGPPCWALWLILKPYYIEIVKLKSM